MIYVSPWWGLAIYIHRQAEHGAPKVLGIPCCCSTSVCHSILRPPSLDTIRRRIKDIVREPLLLGDCGVTATQASLQERPGAHHRSAQTAMTGDHSVSYWILYAAFKVTAMRWYEAHDITWHPQVPVFMHRVQAQL